MRERILMIIALGAGGVACGLSLAGAFDESAGQDGSAEGGSSSGDTEGRVPPPPLDPFEAGIDASLSNCQAACGDAGTCDGGWCVINCNGNNACTPGIVTCPPGIPCNVQCKGNNACKDGVDCANASACNVRCEGNGACLNNPIKCKGDACQVTCVDRSNCLAGIDCDAGTCVLRCLGEEACKNNKVTCNANTCSVECGVKDKTGKGACLAAVECRATKRCDVRCLAETTCQNGNVTAIAGDTVDVTCSGVNSCQGRVFMSSGDSGVSCLENGACKNGIGCDGGKCAAHCKKADSYICCEPDAAPANCVTTTDGCTMDKSCP